MSITLTQNAPESFDAAVLRDLVVAVGADPGLRPEDFDLTFDELLLDSLARVEIAARIKDRYGVDIEERITPDRTPNEVRELVLAQLQGRGE